MLVIKSIPVGRINPAPYNPRKDLRPGDPEYDKLARSISEFGYVEPIVWNERTGTLVGGHQRFKVLLRGGATRVEVSVVDLPPEKEKALNLALNKISGDWDGRKLAELLTELTKTPNFDMALTGFDQPEIENIFQNVLGDAGLKTESFDLAAALEAKGPVVTKEGELIRLGGHRLLCGDSTDPNQVRRLVAAGGGKKAILFATDPPYLVGYDGMNHPGSKGVARGKRTSGGAAMKSGGSGGSGGGSGSESRGGGGGDTKNKDWSGTYGVTWDDHDANPDLYDKFIGAAVKEAIAPNAAWYCWHASRRQAMVEGMWDKHGAFVHCQIIWAKNRPVLTRSWYGWKHEPCFLGWIRGNKPPRRSPDVLPSVWAIDTIPNGEERPDHPTPKPVEVFEIPMRQHTVAGDVCYEPFAGSGTQVIAAERLGRRCLAIEISPRYCDLIVRRWIAFVGADKAPKELVARYTAPAPGLIPARTAAGATAPAPGRAPVAPVRAGKRTARPNPRTQARRTAKRAAAARGRR